MYNTEQIKELIKVLEESSLSVLEIVEKDGSKIRLEKAQPAQQIVNTIPVANGVAAPAPIPTAPVESSPAVTSAPVAMLPIIIGMKNGETFFAPPFSIAIVFFSNV